MKIILLLLLAMSPALLGQTTNYYLVTPYGPPSLIGPTVSPKGHAITVPKVQGQAAIFTGTNAPTPTQIAALFPPLSPLQMAKKIKTSQLKRAYNASLAAGVTVTGTSAGGTLTATLAADDPSQNLLTRFIVLQMAQGTASTATVTIYDINNAPVTGQFQTVEALIVAYGGTIQTAQLDLFAKVAAVKAATTVAAVNAITYP